MLYKASAPGSLMLLGEYAVLRGKTAIVCAINKRIHVTLQPRNDEKITINTSLGQYDTSVNHLTVKAPFTFVLATLASKQKQLPNGCDITIEADFESHLGLGSSAAVTVALVSVLNQWLADCKERFFACRLACGDPTLRHPMDASASMGAPPPGHLLGHYKMRKNLFDEAPGKTCLIKEALWQEAKSIVLTVQSQGSGADIAASIYGGVIAFNASPFHVAPLKNSPPLCAVYSGNKTTTDKAIDLVNQRYAKNPKHFDELFNQLDTLSHRGIQAIHHQDWHSLGSLFNRAQRVMDELGVTNAILRDIIQVLRQQPHVLGAKISGSGLGDCAIGLGTCATDIFPVNRYQKQLGVQQIPLAIETKGVIVDEH